MGSGVCKEEEEEEEKVNGGGRGWDGDCGNGGRRSMSGVRNGNSGSKN